MSTSRKNHKFDKITDKCIICGIVRKKVPYTSNGYNMSLCGAMTIMYSKDELIWTKDFINCIIH